MNSRPHPDGRGWYRTRRLFVGVMVLSTVAMLGCGRDDAAAPGVVRLELWTLALSPYFDDYLRDLNERFEREYAATHGGEAIDVVWVDVPFEALQRKLVSAAAAGRAPDVVNLSDRDFARVASLGGLADLQPLLPPDVTEQYLPGAVRGLRMHGELLALPWYLTTSVRLCNTALLNTGGLSVETLADDWAGLREQARAYHAATGGFLFSLPLGDTSDLPMMMLAEGVVPFRETRSNDGLTRLVADLTSPRVVAYIGQWVALYRDGVLPRAAATRDHSHLVELYQNEQLAVVQTGGNMLGRIRDANPPLLGKTAVLPGLTGALGQSHIAAMVVGVSSASKHPQAAAELAAFLTSPENQTALARRSGVLPSTTASLDDPFFASTGTRPTEDALPQELIDYARSISATSLPRAVAFTPALETWPDLRQSFNEGMKRMLLDGADVGVVLAEVEADWNAKLAAARPATGEALPRVEGVGAGAGARGPTFDERELRGVLHE